MFSHQEGLQALPPINRNCSSSQHLHCLGEIFHKLHFFYFFIHISSPTSRCMSPYYKHYFPIIPLHQYALSLSLSLKQSFELPLFRGQILQTLPHCNRRVGRWDCSQDSCYVYRFYPFNSISLLCIKTSFTNMHSCMYCIT